MTFPPATHIWSSKKPAQDQGFSLLELMVVVGITFILAGLLLPALNRARAKAYDTKCSSGLRQLGLAAAMYWEDNNGRTFRYRSGSADGGDVYWFGWLARGAEGTREFRSEKGALYPYFQGRGIEVCPSFNYRSAKYKLKATGASFGYGYNIYLSAPTSQPAIDTRQLTKPSETVLFADCAQINTFQPPASPANPLLEEFYYLSKEEPTAHFRHARRGKAVMCDGHVSSERMKPGTLDERLPKMAVGRLYDERFILW
jgi:prepilin-type processing-associated H-X9-DG protein